MWNKQLAALVRAYSSGVLTLVEPSGYPLSLRCMVEVDDAREVIRIPQPPALAQGYEGLACLLFHRHNEHLENQYEMLIKGSVSGADGGLIFRPSDFLTGTGSPKTDRMPHAADPIQMIQFMRLGRRKAKEYMAKRQAPWPPIQFEGLIRALNEK
jgi:hypothetical protein